MAKNIVAADLGPQVLDAWKGFEVYDSEEKKLGKLKDVFIDETSKTAKWGLVAIGTFKPEDYFVPLADAVRLDDGIHLTVTKTAIEHAPQFMAGGGKLQPGDEDALARHFEIKSEDQPEDDRPDESSEDKPAEGAPPPAQPQNTASDEPDDTPPDTLPIPETPAETQTNHLDTLEPNTSVKISREGQGSN